MTAVFKTSLFAAAIAMSINGALAADATFKLGSADLAEGQALTNAQVFKGFGCDGKNLSPDLAWTGAPSGTKSFVVTVYDPDAPTGSGWWHWVVYNIPAATTALARGTTAATLPKGAVEAHNDFGTTDFGGACPPAGDKPHRYQFTVFALKVDKLDVDPIASAALVGFMTRANLLGSATWTATYGR